MEAMTSVHRAIVNTTSLAEAQVGLRRHNPDANHGQPAPRRLQSTVLDGDVVRFIYSSNEALAEHAHASGCLHSEHLAGTSFIAPGPVDWVAMGTMTAPLCDRRP